MMLLEILKQCYSYTIDFIDIVFFLFKDLNVNIEFAYIALYAFFYNLSCYHYSKIVVTFNVICINK